MHFLKKKARFPTGKTISENKKMQFPTGKCTF